MSRRNVSHESPSWFEGLTNVQSIRELVHEILQTRNLLHNRRYLPHNPVSPTKDLPKGLLNFFGCIVIRIEMECLCLDFVCLGHFVLSLALPGWDLTQQAFYFGEWLFFSFSIGNLLAQFRDARFWEFISSLSKWFSQFLRKYSKRTSPMTEKTKNA